MIRRTIILSFTAIFSLGLLYLVNRYFWPPVLRLPPSEIAQEAIIATSLGEIRISLDGRSQFAKAQFTRLCREGFYDQNRFHRIVPGLLIETGDPLTKYPDLKFLWGQGGLGTAFKNQTYWTDRFTEGTMAFSGSGAGTFGSQFFITVKDTAWLRNRHTILGHVTSGLDVVHLIESAPASSTGLPGEDIIITSVSCI
jgi:cyclophilin family peptidyl-prolyl cis-trans isomerase